MCMCKSPGIHGGRKEPRGEFMIGRIGQVRPEVTKAYITRKVNPPARLGT